MVTESFKILAPLNDFDWDGQDFELFPRLWIKRHDQIPNLHGRDSRLSEDERERLFFATHWLEFPWNESSEPSPAATVNLVLLALWVVKPTKVQVGYRFKLAEATAGSGSGGSRLLDRFQSNPAEEYIRFSDSDLTTASNYYDVLCELHRRRGRLNDALVLTLSGCCSHRWQVALVCYAAGAETLLTYGRSPGATKRLSTAYACLVESKQAKRDAAFEEFRALYKTRSDIVHGRSHDVPLSGRLAEVARFARTIRRLWQEVIRSPERLRVLEDTDTEREAFFDNLCSEYRCEHC